MNETDVSKDSEDEENLSDEGIRWSNLIFLPFNPIFEKLVIIVAVVKTILGPIQCVYPIVYCWNTLELTPLLYCVKIFYMYCCDPIYGIDTFLHILHRQVIDQALRREYLPKPAFLLLLDIISLIPFVRLVSNDVCPPLRPWPNILAISEFVIIYRIADYHSLMSSHSYVGIIFGYTLLLLILVNFLTSLTVLLTYYGMCNRCSGAIIYDWRQTILYKINYTDVSYSVYFYAATVIFSSLFNILFDFIKPSTILEYVLYCILLLIGYLVHTFLVTPKIFAETLFRDKKKWLFYIKVNRMTGETKRRNPGSEVHVNVEKFFTLMWKRRHGITSLPDVVTQFPRYLRIDIKQDLVWQMFFHSPLLRRTSEPFQRFLCECVHIDYKLPGETFYAGPYCHTHLYYLKSGVVQILSSDDGITPLISVTSGTIFGDLCFILPHEKKHNTVRCLTYCEVMYIKRVDMITSIHKFPNDRFIILDQITARIEHAHTLYTCKNNIEGINRSEEEGMAWLKKRWWMIADALNRWKAKGRRKYYAFEVPPEESVYHCAKYIGMLVLHNDVKLRTKSIFVNMKYPWMLVSESIFQDVWKCVVYFTVFIVLILYPPICSSSNIPQWFHLIEFWVDLVYTADICIFLLTYTVRHGESSRDFAAVVFGHCKTMKFALDVLSAIWIEKIMYVCGVRNHYHCFKFNRLIKIYVFFIAWTIKDHPLIDTYYKVFLKLFSYLYISVFVMFYLIQHVPHLSVKYYFGVDFCGQQNDTIVECDFKELHPMKIFFSFVAELLFHEIVPTTKIDVVVGIIYCYIAFIIYFHCKMKMLASFYFNSRGIVNYQNFVTNINRLFKGYNTHPDLLRRLNKYLICIWKNQKGMEVMYPSLLKNEPYDVYLKVQGKVAEAVIRESKVFLSADPALIKELAFNATFLIVPQGATVISFGLPFKTLTWLVNGCISITYPNEQSGNTYSPGDFLCSMSLFFGSVSLMALTAYTDCEILYINTKDFFNILKYYPHEWQCFETCRKEFGPRLDDVVRDEIRQYENYRKDLASREYQENTIEGSSEDSRTKFVVKSTWINPSSIFMKYWMLFRAAVVPISIISASVQGQAHGATHRRPFIVIGYICDCVSLVDIVLKMNLSYYDNRGILISSGCMRLRHYLSRGFICDLVGCLPCTYLIQLVLTKPVTQTRALLINTVSKLAHVYLMTGYFDYRADLPNVNYAVLMIIKWQVVMMLMIVAGSQFFVSQCVDLEWHENGTIANITLQEGCWFIKLNQQNQTVDENTFKLISIVCLYIVQGGFMAHNFGMNQINKGNYGVGFVKFFLGAIFWFMMCYMLTLFMLNYYRGNALFQHGVGQLEKFLTAERVDKKLIEKTVAHFRYWWLRTQGINVHLLQNRVGNVVLEDICHYFFKKSVEPLSTMVHGGETLERELSRSMSVLYFLPGEVVVREMGLNPCIYIVHRGKIRITKGGEDMVVLSKGSVFGQLDGTKPRPLRVTAVADKHADLLEISIQEFQENIDDEARKIISMNSGPGDDYIKMKKFVAENPYNSLEYLLRGRKSIQLPWMNVSSKPQANTWYRKWLFLTWVFGPVLGSTLSLLACCFPLKDSYVMWVLWSLDALHLAYLVSEYFTTELIVSNGKCVLRVLKWRIIKKWGFYVDLVSMVLPLIPSIKLWNYFSRLLRLRLLYDFHVNFCKGFRSRLAPVMLKYIIVFLLLHSMTCGWIMVACRDTEFVMFLRPTKVRNETINFDEWTLPHIRRQGCVRPTGLFHLVDTLDVGFLVPKNWSGDYIVALTFIIILFTNTDIDLILALEYYQFLFRVIAGFILYAMGLWLLSVAITAIYTRLRDLYVYDYSVKNVIQYLKMAGLCPVLLKSVQEYTEQLWKRQRGNWLPELALQAPLCLREDLFSALYIHHLQIPPLFRKLPLHFMRQMVARVKRVVIFPGKFIVREGDIFSCMYFIHEGEVEKWHKGKDGESKLQSVLTTNGYFGLVPALFPNIPFQFSYYSRTVVDLVFLRHSDWYDLLRAYPDVKKIFYEEAQLFKK